MVKAVRFVTHGANSPQIPGLSRRGARSAAPESSVATAFRSQIHRQFIAKA
jgi:hypothetical protein